MELDEVIALDIENRNTKQEADNLRYERNTISKQIGNLMSQGKKMKLWLLRTRLRSSPIFEGA